MECNSTSAPTVIHHLYTPNVEGLEALGETDAFFDVDFKLLHTRSRNDAEWRHEHMAPLLSKLEGVKVVSLPQEAEAQAVAQLKQHFGL